MGTFAAVTIVAHNYLPQARILAESFREHHPLDDFYVVVVDRPVKARLVPEEHLEILTLTDIDFGTEGFAHMASMYDVTEFATAVKPFALRQLLHSYDCVFYIDPDIKLFAALEPLIEMTLEFGWSLTPHSMKPIARNGFQPTEQEIKGAGIYNLGFVGVTRRATEMLDWWAERLRRDSVIDVPNQLFTDQRWIDMAVAIFPAYVERGTSYNVAYWNIDHRRVWKNGSIYMVDDDVLRFFHFSGYDPSEPHWISKYQQGRPRVLLSEHPVVAELCQSYGASLSAARDAIAQTEHYGWRDIIPGFTWTRALRQFYRREVMEAEREGCPLPPSPYDIGGPIAFIEWLRSVGQTDSSGLPRHIAALYWARTDLQHYFPEVTVGDHQRFQEWLRERGPVEVESIRLLGSELPDSRREVFIPGDVGRDTSGVDLIGYLNAEVGIGEAGRLAARALRAADVPLSTIHYSRTMSRQDIPFASDENARFRTLFLSVNADQIPVVCGDLGPGFLKGRYVISQWFWELEKLPQWYGTAYRFVDEVWAPTHFIHDALADHVPSGVELRHMQLPLVAPSPRAGVGRTDFRLGPEFTFLFTFDFFSIAKRKNPLGLIEAYKDAFAPSDGARLVLKTINGSHRIQELEAVKWATRGRPDIVLMDDYMETDLVAALMNCCDAYVSLHRSEGLGLTLAEAMLLGKPVIATGYGGNMDFMTEFNSLPVAWERRAVGLRAGPYDPTAEWAEPSLSDASTKMRYLFENREAAMAIGGVARRDLESKFSAEVCGLRMKSRLQEIWG
jgi:glycosyltransferase involved in cell wall biosynthesis